MRVLVCGDRYWNDWQYLYDTLDELKDKIDVIIEGEAPGADTMALRWAKDSGIPVERYPAQWDKYGKSAGPIRNKQMLDEGKPDLVIAFHANISASRGTKNMISQAQAAGIQVILEPLDAYKA